MITEEEKKEIKEEILHELYKFVPNLKNKIELEKYYSELPDDTSITITDGFGTVRWRKLSNNCWRMIDIEVGP